MKKLIAIVIFMSLLLTGCDSANSLTDNSLRKMLEQDEMDSVVDISSITIREIQDLTCDEYNKFALVKGIIKDSNQYMFYPIFVNTQSSSVRDVHFEAPLTTITPYFLGKADEGETIEFFNRMAECVNQYGIDYFSSTENARDFLRDIAGQSGIISIAKARDVITDNFYNVYNSYDKFSVFFERGTAIPKYLAAQASGMVYNWNSILREDVYSVWEASTDKETQDFMWSVYGPPYVMGTIWELAELNGSIEPVGKFQSLDDIPTMFDVDTKNYISGTNEIFSSTSNQVTAKHILVQDYELAKELLDRIKQGEDFDKLMYEYTEDPGTKSNPNGYTFKHGVMVKEFEDAAFALSINEVSDVVKSSYGYHIIKRVE